MTKEQRNEYMRAYRKRNGKGHVNTQAKRKDKIPCPICSCIVNRDHLYKHKRNPKCQLQKRINDLTQQLEVANM